MTKCYDIEEEKGIDGISYETLFENACVEIASLLNSIEADPQKDDAYVSELDIEGLEVVLDTAHWRKVSSVIRWEKPLASFSIGSRLQ